MDRLIDWLVFNANRSNISAIWLRVYFGMSSFIDWKQI